jgi:hypothetical protein
MRTLQKRTRTIPHTEKYADVSEEHIASIFRVDEIPVSSAKTGRRYHLVRYNAM